MRKICSPSGFVIPVAALLFSQLGCATLRGPISSPTWITPQLAPPQARARSQYDREVRLDMKDLKQRLEQEYKCCGSNEACRTELQRVGTEVWDKSLTTYEVVHTNLPVADKTKRLSELKENIGAIDVCSRKH